ncbi:Tab2/Atab2 family RNA-binding protein, partial [Nostoc sp. CHAB 5836]|uniref:Tab2 family RNA-binding protein n=1 Tax=Nostoc sp. CHAB 5836 TaxID=2780404 RepID=UPI001E59DCA8|nr:Tab2/Atab2 family RNA-binding protein [Nostoc sp. CHAB 5836]
FCATTLAPAALILFSHLAKGFEEAKQKANGVHFIGVQSDPKAQSFAGFWLLQEVNL